jgi:hypothetical protein
MTSVVEYERFMVEGDTVILDAVEANNRDDAGGPSQVVGVLQGLREAATAQEQA